MKNILIALIQNILKLFYVFPIKSNKVFFSSYGGKNYSCNPKYITEVLLSNDEEQLDIYWAFTSPEKFTYLDKRIKTVKFKSINYLYHLLTSKVVVDNVESWSILPKRKAQCVINTWHGGGAYKGVGLRRLDTTNEHDKNMLRKHSRITLYVSSSKEFTESTLRKSFGYTGDVIQCGMPRNDLLIKNSHEDKERVREKLGVNKDDKIILFAPTFRKDPEYSFSLEHGPILEALSQRFGGSWKFLYRAHYYRDSGDESLGSILDVTDYPDMQELLLISDALITDYSSSIWDFSLMFKPAFLYTPDLGDYNKERDFYTPIEQWPYPYSVNMKDLVKSILAFDENDAVARIKMHHQELGSCESGEASVILSNFIIEECKKRRN